jgi:ferric-dicitrate binding protein FerR (iron transport regulator)
MMSDEEEATARLIRLAGARPDAPAERTVRIRETVRREWQSSRRRRWIRRTATMTAAVLAAAAILVLIVRVSPPRETAPPPVEHIVATDERIEGTPVLRRQVDGRDEVLRLSPSTSIFVEDVIQTDGNSRAALRTTDGSSVRLDRGSRMRFVAPAIVELVEGAVYIATSERSGRFEVRTSIGTVHDVGTQFEIRLHETSLRVRVRTGLVEIRRRDGVVPAHAGSETTVGAGGVDTRRVSTYGPEWNWTASLAPGFTIEGRSLQAFLDHMTREQGWTLRYADPTLPAAASRTLLHGSVDGLQPEEALAVALATSGLSYRLQDGELLVSRPAGAQ